MTICQNLTYYFRSDKLVMKRQEKWEVRIHRRVQKIFTYLPLIVRNELTALLLDIRHQGPVRGNWKNYSKLGKDEHHCHIKNGRPSYVCCWRADPFLKIVEVYYVGTHEKAPY